MPIVPNKITDIIAFARAHHTSWIRHPQQIGLSQSELDTLGAVIDQIEDDQAGAIAARTASKAATATRNDTLDILLALLSSLIKSIDAYASKTASARAIYNLAELPFHRTPQELDAPPPPANVLAQITNLGSVVLTWRVPSKDAYRGATYYIVQRSLRRIGQGDTPFIVIGQPADRAFVDETIPTGYAGATYRVFATRNNKTSDATAVNVNFGVINAAPAASQADPCLNQAA